MRCEGVASTDGGPYKWRVTWLEMDRPPSAAEGEGAAPSAPGQYGVPAQQAYSAAAPAQQQVGRLASGCEQGPPELSRGSRS